jgi:hypothetical protein
MKETLRNLILIMAAISGPALADGIADGFTIYSSANWSNLKIVNINNPSTVCKETGKVLAGTTLVLSKEELNSALLKPCYASNSFGLIFYGNLTNNPFPPQFAKPAQRCTANYKMLSGLVFSCQNM